MRRYLLLALMIGCLGHAPAQTPGMALGTPLPVPMPSSFAPSVRGVGVGSPAFPRRLHRQRFFGARPLAIFPFFFDDVDAREPEYVPVPVYVPQPSAPPAPQVSAPPAEPLLIEREGNRFVRYGGTPAAEAGPQTESRRLSDYRSSAEKPRPAPELPPVVLIARDGRRWETASYLISGPVLYDYTPPRVVPIPLAELDLPATMRLNRQRGIEFRVPQSPNEVMLRF